MYRRLPHLLFPVNEKESMVESASHVGTRIERRDMARNNRTVFQRADGTWANKKNGAERSSSVHDTQRQAEQAAKAMLKNTGGGELTIKGENGRIRSKDTIAPGNDPNPPKDREH